MTDDDMLNSDRLARAVDAIRSPVGIAPGLSDRIAARRRRESQRMAARGGVGVLAAIADGAMVVLRPGPAGERVTFAIRAPEVQQVALVGDFTDWRTDQVKLEEAGDGEWRVTMKLPPGRYRFAYVVDDGEWRADDDAAPVMDDFGRPTSILTVAE